MKPMDVKNDSFEYNDSLNIMKNQMKKSPKFKHIR